jgi:hypothetical protein
MHRLSPLITPAPPGAFFKRDLCCVCGFPLKQCVPRYSTFEIACIRCGEYQIGRRKGEPSAKITVPLSETHKNNISAHIRENQRILITDTLVAELQKLAALSLNERAMKVFNAIARQSRRFGTVVHIPHATFDDRYGSIEWHLSPSGDLWAEININEFANTAFWLAVARVNSAQELGYVLQDVLVAKGLLKNQGDAESLSMTPEGWSLVEETNSKGTSNLPIQ